VLPQVTAVSPVTGTGAGGDSVTITGSGFTSAMAVDFGGVSAVMTVSSDTEITATSPPGSGTVDITVVTPGGTSAASTADQFTYVG
jgi:IPT/TIG domain